jgi:hypothetical protein
MTRLHFLLISAAVKAARAKIIDCEPQASQTDLLDGVAYAVEYIGDALAADNPHGFDRARFLRDCGVQS